MQLAKNLFKLWESKTLLYITYSATRKTHVAVAHILKWSTLRRIGNAPIMRLVMLAPILAYAILFNEYVFDFFKQIAINIGGETVQVSNITNLYFLYYGLVSLGIGSILYSILCPNYIKRFLDGIAFAQASQTMNATTVAMSHFDDVLGKFIENSEKLDMENEASNYAENTRLLTMDLILEIYKVYLEGQPLENSEELEEFHGEFRTGSGYFVAESIAKGVYDEAKVTWAFSKSYRAIALKNFVADIDFLKYEIEDHSKVIARFAVAIFYAVGFLLLSIPSISSFIKILNAML